MTKKMKIKYAVCLPLMTLFLVLGALGARDSFLATGALWPLSSMVCVLWCGKSNRLSLRRANRINRNKITPGC